LAALEERLGHRFRNRELLKLALSHASIGAESNERLEFLGDRVLGLIIAERLYPIMPVLSHVEIVRGVDVQSLGTIS